MAKEVFITIKIGRPKPEILSDKRQRLSELPEPLPVEPGIYKWTRWEFKEWWCDPAIGAGEITSSKAAWLKAEEEGSGK